MQIAMVNRELVDVGSRAPSPAAMDTAASTVPMTPIVGTATGENGETRPRLRHVAGSAGLIVVMIFASYLLWRGLDRRLFAARAAYVPLAGVILIAQAIERLLEPVSDYLLTKRGEEERNDVTVREAANACADVAKRHADVQPLVV